MTTEHTNPVPDLTIPLSTADARALGDDVGQLAMRLGAVMHGLTGWSASGTPPQYASTPHRPARMARWRAPWASSRPPRSPAATPC